MSACHAVEQALAIELPDELRDLRRLLYCGEWIESHVLHMIMLQAADMHESALARRLVSLQQAAGGRVRALRGRDRTAVARGSRTAFEAHARGTVVEGARLELAIVHVRARCCSCGRHYLPEHHLVLCPDCGSSDGELLAETGLRIDSIDVDSA